MSKHDKSWLETEVEKIWLEKKIAEYANNPSDTLLTLLKHTTDSIQIFLNTPDNNAAINLLIIVARCNARLLNKIRDDKAQIKP